MKLTVENFRGISTAKIELSDKITLIAGLNHQGKTSLIRALQVLLTASTPVKEELREGTAGGSISLSNGEGNFRSVDIPGKPFQAGKPPECSKYAAGMANLCKVDKKDRPVEFNRVLKAEPDHNELFAALVAEDFDESSAIAVAEQVFGEVDCGGELVKDGKGWDGAHKHYKEHGAKLKGAWEQHTQQKRWGANIGAEWKPALWTPLIAEAGREALEKAFNTAKAELEEALKAGAVAAHEIAKLKQLAESKEALLAERAEWQDKVKDYETNRKHQEERLRENPAPSAMQTGYECAYCGEVNSLQNGKLIRGDKTISRAQFEELKAKHEEIRKQAAHFKDLHENALLAFRMKNAEAQAAIQAEKDLAALEEQPQADPATVESAREAVRKVEGKLALFDKKKTADHLHSRIVENEKIVALLAPEGLRKQKLAESLDAFNAKLSELCKKAKFPICQIDQELNAVLENDGSGRAYGLAARSERSMIDAIVRLAVAQIENAPVVVFDDADDLLPDHRGGLFMLLAGCGIPAVVGCATATRDGKPLIPPMAKFGVAYWVSNGTAEVLA